MTTDPYYDALRTAQAEPEAAALLMSPELLAALAPQSVPDPSYTAPTVTTIEAVAPGADVDVPVRVYLPADGAAGSARPLVLWCHGGGWVEGGFNDEWGDAEAVEVCARLDAVVVSPDYRLALEGVYYPAPVDDVLAAWRWALDHAATWGATAERTAIGGGSAGGNLAAGAALRLRDGQGPLPSVLILNVPPLHPHLPPLTQQERSELFLTEQGEEVWRKGVRLGFENYMGCPVEEATIYAAPGVGDPSGLPPTLLITCEYDVLRASARVFAESLETAGVRHKLLTYPGVGHGHTTAPWLPAARETYEEMAAWLKGA